MNLNNQLEKIERKEIHSVINCYVFLGELNSGKTEYLKTKENFLYVDFEDMAESFFIKNKMTLNIFDIGKFFKEISTIIEKSAKNVIIDNLEIIENILYIKSSEGKELKKFFKSMILQSYRKKVIFVFSDIKIMKIEKYLKGVLPEKNIIKWRGKNEN